MRKLFFLSCLISLSMTAIQAQKLSAKIDSVGYLPTTLCRVSTIAGAYLLTPEENPNMRYAPANMTTTYQKEGALVRVSGVIGAIPPNVRMVGTPFRINTIEFAETVTGGTKPSKGEGDIKPQKSRGEGKNANTVIYNIPLKDVRGTIRKITADQYVIEAGSTRYMPDKLADDLKIEGYRVRFWGKVGKVPPNARLLGTPLQISKIMKDKGKPRKKDKSPKATRVVMEK